MILTKEHRSYYWIKVTLFTLLLVGAGEYGYGQDTTQVSVEEEQKAQEVANDWLSLVDSLEYAASWQQAAPVLQQRESESTWEQSLESVHGPLGPLLYRSVQDRESTSEAPNLPEGEYVVIVYESSFTQLEAATETVIVTKTDQSWQVADYSITPAQ